MTVFGTATCAAKIADANDSVLIIAKLESAEAIENAEAIMSVPGIDVALVTGTDLMLDMGIPGEPEHPEIRQAMERVLEVCRRTGKTAACAAFDIETGQKRLAEGYRFIQFSWDIGLFQEALRAGIRRCAAECRMSVGEFRANDGQTFQQFVGRKPGQEAGSSRLPDCRAKARMIARTPDICCSSSEIAFSTWRRSQAARMAPCSRRDLRLPSTSDI